MSSALLTYQEAAAQVAAYATQLARNHPAAERVELLQARGRVLAQSLCSDSDQPPFSRSTRDGYAGRSAEIMLRAPLRIAGATRAGDAPPGPLPAGAVWEIMTGAPVPEGADAVIMVEYVEVVGEPPAATARLLSPHTAADGDNIIFRGMQARQGDELLAPGCALDPMQMALAASCGYAALQVFVRPRVAILVTGDELVPVNSVPPPGKIRNSNGPMLAAMVAAAGGLPRLLPIAADNSESLDVALDQAADADLLLITGGVSAGKFDLVEPALARAGARFHFTGVRMQPGKPVVFGDLPRQGSVTAIRPQDQRRPFFGLPGNPVSSAVTFLLFAAPVLAALAGRRQLGPRFALAYLAADAKTKTGLTRFLPAHCSFAAHDGQSPQAAPVSWQGSGDIPALARSNCFLVVPDQAHPLKAGEIVPILLP